MDSYYFGKPKKSSYVFNPGNYITAKNSDKNYITSSEDGIIFINATYPVFEIGGIVHPDDNGNEYARLDVSHFDEYTDAHKWLMKSTSGGSLRFFTNAAKIVLRVKYRGCNLGMHHFCDRGVYGFDMYIGTGTDRKYIGKMMQTFADNPTENTQTLEMPGTPEELLIEFPLYGGIEKLEIGVPENAFICKPSPRTFAPVAFYGSSITQGGCVSRPGTMYSNIICRALDADNVNLGFSGTAFGELYAAKQLAKRDLSCFVMDYDYNSRSTEELDTTHEPFYETVREGHPDMPIIIVSHPCFWDETENDVKKSSITKRTYNKAKKRGDNVYYVDGAKFFPAPMKDIFAVDNLHPNDLGHYYMAKGIWRELKKAFGI